MIGLPTPGALLTNPWVILGVAAALAVSHGYVYVRGRADGAAGIQAKWDAQLAATATDALNKTVEIQEAVRKYGEARDKELSAVTTRLSRRVAELRNRAERRVPDPAAPSCAGATGAELSRPDGEFLERDIAARANRFRADLAICQAAYEKARELVHPVTPK